MGRFHSRSWAAFAAVGLTLALAAMSPAEEARTWTDSTGAHKRVATFDRLEGNVVYLRTNEGKTAKVALEKLSSADQAYARNAAASGPDPFEEVESPASTSPAVPESATDSEPDDPNLRSVIAEGAGVNVEKAKKDAYREAVRQVVGAYVDSAQLLKNDKLIEDRIITLSSAYVEKASPPLSVTNQDGIVRVKVRAWVRLSKVLETLKESNVVLKVDNTSFVAELQTRADQSEGEEALMSRVFAAYPANSFKASVVGKPEIKKVSSSGATIRIGVKIEPDLEQYLVVAQKIEAALGSTGRPSGSFSVDGKKLTDGMTSVMKNTPDYWYKWGHLAEGVFAALPQADRQRLKNEQSNDGPCASLSIPNVFHLWPAEEQDDTWGGGLSGLMEGKWNRLRPAVDTHVVFLMMTKSNASGQRTSWKWFLLEKAEAREWFAPACKNMICTLSLLDGRDQELLEDRFVFSRLGWQVLSWRSSAQYTYVCGPAITDRNGLWYIPSFTYTRQLEVEPAEIEGLASVKCSLVNGDTPERVWGVTD